MKRLWMSGAAAVMALSLGSLQAQTPQYPPQTTPPQTQPPASAAQDTATVTLTGCVYNEKDIPGRAPNVAEKAGMMEDYILVASGDTSGGVAGTTGTTPPTAGTTGMRVKAFKLEKIEDDKLKAVVGKRVEVTGKPENKSVAGAPDKNPMSPDQIELPEFEVSSLREVEGTCPATPQIRK